MVSFSNVGFRYGSRWVLEGLTFTAQPGKCTVLAGPNGIGKSTALALAAGVLKPASGRIRRSGSVGYAPQEGGLLSDLSVRGNLLFFGGLRGAEIPKTPFLPLEEAGNRRVGKLSGGMQKRVSLVCAELGSPEILLLDEPCTGLDVAAQKLLLTRIGQWKQEGRCILYAGHNIGELEAVCDQLVLLGQGKHTVLTREEISDLPGLLGKWIEE